MLRQWRRDDPDGGVDEFLDRALAGVEALEVASALSQSDAARWRDRLRSDAAADLPRPDANADARAAGEVLLDDLLADLAPEPELDEQRLERFEGALHLLATVGAADAARWDGRLRERLGWPTAEEEREHEREVNAGATEVDLVAVVPGPEQRRAGHRVMVVLRYTDGIAFVIDKGPSADDELEWPEWELVDDRGTPYWPGGSGGGDREEHVTFRPAPPPEARWVELVLEGHVEAAFRVEL